MTYVVLHEYGLGRLMEIPSKGGVPFMAALDLVIAMPISGSLWCATIRGTENEREPPSGEPGRAISSSVPGCTPSVSPRPGHPISHAGEHGAGTDGGPRLAAPAMIIVLFSTFTTTFLDIYSTAVSALNIRPRMGERRGSLACGVLGTALALMFPATAYEGFLLFVGSVFCPLFGVVLADYFFLRRTRYFEAGTDRCENLLVPVGFQSLGLRGLGSGFRILSSPSATDGVGFLYPQPSGYWGFCISSSWAFSMGGPGPGALGMGVLREYPTEQEEGRSVR